MRDYTRNQMDHFRQQLQLLILGKGLTRKELSRKLNRNPNTIQQWITNKNIKQQKRPSKNYANSSTLTRRH